MGRIAAAAKGLVYQAFAWSPLPAFARRQRRNQILILGYHNIVEHAEDRVGESSLHLLRSAFSQHLDHLARHYEVVALADIFKPPRSSRPHVAITFDDAYIGAVEYGVAELRRRSMPALIFVPPGLLGAAATWWDQYSGSPQDGQPSLRSVALTEDRGDAAAIRQRAAATGITARPPHPPQRIATEAELRAATDYDGLSLGAHTWSHPNLSMITEPELESELRRPLPWLTERFARVEPFVAYPYGLYNARVERAARAAGYEQGFAILGGWTQRTPPSPMAVPRFNVPGGITQLVFEAYVSGFGNLASRATTGVSAGE